MGKSDVEKQTYTKEQTPRDEAQIVGCLKGVISLISSRAPEQLIEEHKKKNPELSAIVLTNEDKAFLRETISKCAQAELEGAQSFDQLTKNLDVVRNKCGVELLSQKRAQRAIFAPVVRQSLANMGLNEREQNALTEEILVLAEEEVRQSKTTDEIMERVQKLKGKAASKVIDFVLLSKIKSSLDGDPADVERKALAIRDRIKPLLLNDQDRLGEKLDQAMAGTDAELNAVLEQLKTKALVLIAPEVVGDIGQQMLEEKLLSSQTQIDVLKNQARSSIEECLNNSTGKADEKIESCMVDVQVDVLQNAVKLILGEQFNKDSLKRFVNPEQINQIIEKIAGEKLREKALEMAKAPASEKKRLMLEIKKYVKVQAAKELTPVLVPALVNDLLSVPNHFTADERAAFLLQRETSISDGKKVLDQCLEEVESPNSKDELFDECLNRFRFALTESFAPLKMKDILSLVTSNKSVLDEALAKQVQGLRMCVRSIGFNQKMEVFDVKMDECLTALIHDTTLDLVTTLSKDAALTLTEQSKMQDFNKCVLESKQRNIATKPIVLSNAIDSVQQCLINKGVGPLLKGVVAKIVDVSGDNLTLRSKNAMNALADSLDHIVSYKTSQGKELFLDIESIRSKEERAPREQTWPGVVEFIKKFMPDAAKYINGAVNYDYDTLMRSITKFEGDAKALIERKDGHVDIAELNQLLANSDMMDVLIKGFIADQIKAELVPFFQKYDLDMALIPYLSSKEMIDSLFSSRNPKGAQALKNLKEKWLLPVLNNKTTKIELPAKEIGDIKAVLAADTRMNGFAETILGAVVQKELDQQRAGIETGLKSIIAIPIATLWHGVQRKDFFWGNRFDGGHSDNLRYQKSGKKAIDHFSTNILSPLMSGNLSDAQMDREKKKISELVEKAMHENSWP